MRNAFRLEKWLGLKKVNISMEEPQRPPLHPVQRRPNCPTSPKATLLSVGCPPCEVTGRLGAYTDRACAQSFVPMSMQMGEYSRPRFSRESASGSPSPSRLRPTCSNWRWVLSGGRSPAEKNRPNLAKPPPERSGGLHNAPTLTLPACSFAPTARRYLPSSAYFAYPYFWLLCK